MPGSGIWSPSKVPVAIRAKETDGTLQKIPLARIPVEMLQKDTVFDLIGLGFGPANIAIACALTEDWENQKVC